VGAAADWLAWRPEWPVAALSGAAWAVLLVQHTGASGAVGAHHGATTATTAHTTSLTWWTVMCVAMMVPLALPGARHVGLNSPHGRRLAGVAVFTTAFLLPWVAYGAVVLWLADLALSRGLTPAALGSGLLVLAAAWQLTHWKRQAVLSCSRSVPLAPFGTRAVATRVEFGARQSLRCMAACWPLMALMAVLPHGRAGLLAMVLITVAMVAEAQSRHRRPLIPWLAAPLVLAAAVAGAMVV
jgi:predicted metal-binding membrane protein